MNGGWYLVLFCLLNCVFIGLDLFRVIIFFCFYRRGVFFSLYKDVFIDVSGGFIRVYFGLFWVFWMIFFYGLFISVIFRRVIFKVF